MSIQVDFETFHTTNPHVYAKLVELAQQVKATGRTNYSIKSLFERLRWHYQFDVVTSEQFKLNNNYTSRYARLIMHEPEFAGFFRVRTLLAQ